jgi:hypothetical protein
MKIQLDLDQETSFILGIHGAYTKQTKVESAQQILKLFLAKWKKEANLKDAP